MEKANYKIGDIVHLKYDNVNCVVNKISVIFEKELYHYESVNEKGNIVYGACENDDIDRMCNSQERIDIVLRIKEVKSYE